MKINVTQLRENLPKQQEYLRTYTPGLFKVIEVAHTERSSVDVDWNSFTFQETKEALELANYYVCDESVDEVESDVPPNEGNAIHEFLHGLEILHDLKRIKPIPSGIKSFF